MTASTTRPRVAIPMPHSIDREYAERSIPQYERAVEQAGGEPVRIPLDLPEAEVMKLIERCDAVLLPGSNADVDPVRFGASRSPQTATADPRRDVVDNLLLQDAYNSRKPVLGICYGLQSLNVYRSGSLIQHIPDFLPEELRTKVDHEAGKKVAIAHAVEIQKNSTLARILANTAELSSAVLAGRNAGADKTGEGRDFSLGDIAPRENRDSTSDGNKLVLPVNSSHHQSADAIGDGLRIVARCTDDGIIEALEGITPDHFVLAVQWHPERSVNLDEASRAIFRALIQAAIK